MSLRSLWLNRYTVLLEFLMAFGTLPGHARSVPTVRVTRWWAEGDNTTLPELTSSHEKCLNTRRLVLLLQPVPVYSLSNLAKDLLLLGMDIAKGTWTDI